MPIPDYQTIMLPLLKLLASNPESSTIHAVDSLAKAFGLSQNEKTRLLPSGKRTIFYDRVSWATKYLRHGGLIERTSRGHYSVSRRGFAVLRKNPKKIDVKYLQQFNSFLDYIAPAYPNLFKKKD